MSNIFGRGRTQIVGTFLLVLVVLLPGASLAAPSLSFSRSTAATPLPASIAWGWPLAGKPGVLRAFDQPAKPWLSGHRGVDLAAPRGSPVLAPTSGVVTFAGVVANRPVLTITVDNGLRLSFEPVVSEVKVGDSVIRGQELGVVEGPTHCDGAPAPADSCLHWGVRRGETYLDPLQFIFDLRPSVLLPLIN
ncbi:M23 family metallopeptidase [Arthrobacter glacialis]|uniref:M23 family metallopeptidase n=1 Tax=Arthrobacter glacialis TaxID=1664 RepID=UPI000CD3C06C|nr:M23 family metallopeptidase [Arthrobacter glacialis]POH60532.1 peptidase M23 [Arthrobacter glacialis]